MLGQILIPELTGSWWWCVTFKITGILDFVHRPEFKITRKHKFQKLDLFQSSGEWGEPPTEAEGKKSSFRSYLLLRKMHQARPPVILKSSSV
jgi:hypothetical protein